RVRREQGGRGRPDPGALPCPGRPERGGGPLQRGGQVHRDDGPGAAARARRGVDLRAHSALEDEGPRRELRAGGDDRGEADAAATKPFGFMKFTPGPGVGGHCIPLDPHYLAWKMRTLNYRTRFIELAGEINAEMPEYWVARVVDRLNEQGRAARGSRVLVMGV